MIYFKTRVLKYITFTFVPATFELYQLGVPIRVKKRYILVLHGEVYRFRGPYKDDLRKEKPETSQDHICTHREIDLLHREVRV